ncbi:MAG: hypothetical protein N4A47_03365 [Clostridia bacterium]|jgi:hypothetical protein|nr:hypothetical protein [Clostridia bacterium]
MISVKFQNEDGTINVAKEVNDELLKRIMNANMKIIYKGEEYFVVSSGFDITTGKVIAWIE